MKVGHFGAGHKIVLELGLVLDVAISTLVPSFGTPAVYAEERRGERLDRALLQTNASITKQLALQSVQVRAAFDLGGPAAACNVTILQNAVRGVCAPVVGVDLGSRRAVYKGTALSWNGAWDLQSKTEEGGL